MNNELIPFNITEYLSQVLQNGDNEEFIRAIGYITPPPHNEASTP